MRIHWCSNSLPNLLEIASRIQKEFRNSRIQKDYYDFHSIPYHQSGYGNVQHPFASTLNLPIADTVLNDVGEGRHLKMLRTGRSFVSVAEQLFVRRGFAAPAGGKAIDLKKKTNLNVGTIGHIDHGKTTLTAAITKVLSQKGKAKFIKFDEIDKGKEEKKRGITINIAHIGYESDKRRYAHTDCPGHSDFIKNMICGTAQMDAAVLVIAATDGVMAQTREHMLLARQIGLKHLIVFINKADLVDEDVLDLVEIETRELLTEIGFDGENTQFIRGSALEALEGGKADSINELVSALDGIPEPSRLQVGPMLTDPFKVFLGCSFGDADCVEDGHYRPWYGSRGDGGARHDQEGRQSANQGHWRRRADGCLRHSRIRKEREGAGEHCGVLCRGLKTEHVARGMWMGAPGSIQTSNLFKVELYLLGEHEHGRKQAIRTGFSDKVFSSTWDEVGRFLIPGEMLMPGEHSSGYMCFLKEVPCRKNMPFTVREGKDRKTIARGIITELLEPKAIQSFQKIDLDEVFKEVKPIES
uniref:protein-synthesizing GTPase n=1 Tax=Steinernema glaseri TaxID=37863 RepID=A0A1I7ZDK6_9BILA